jgi:hypothetical protein
VEGGKVEGGEEKEVEERKKEVEERKKERKKGGEEEEVEERKEVEEERKEVEERKKEVERRREGYLQLRLRLKIISFQQLLLRILLLCPLLRVGNWLESKRGRERKEQKNTGTNLRIHLEENNTKPSNLINE